MYFWGKRSTDDLVSKRSKDLTQSPATTRWWHFVTDHQFSVRAVIDGASKAVHERVEYDAHGRPRVWLGADIYPINGPDGQINTFDYGSQYISWFNALDPRADLNGDGQVNFHDLTIYAGLYNSQQYGGCLSDANPLGPMNAIGFAGYHWDEELGLWLSRHRVYDPELGRWVQRDPAGYIDGLSLYLYAGGNPFSFIDPTGLAKATWRETIGMFFKKETRAEMVRATVSGAGEGVAIAANTYTFGATDALGVTDTSQLNESYHNASRVAATVSRDVAIAATGLGAAQKAAQGGQAANVVAKTANVYDKVQDAKDTAGALVAAASGDPAAVTAVAVGKAAGSAVGKAAPNSTRSPSPSTGSANPVHKNSNDYVGETHVYAIRSPDGSPYKIGESAQGVRRRDGQSVRAERQVRDFNRKYGPGHTSEIRKTFGNKADARRYETRLIERYRRMYGEDKLPGNETNR